MREHELLYVTNEVIGQINSLIDAFVVASGKQTSKQLFEKITVLFPIERSKPDSVRRRVEGYYYASEFLFKRLIQAGRSRSQIVSDAALRPLSQYHYTVGSREPRNSMLNRDDYLVDPGTSLVKLKDDIISLGDLLLKGAK